MSRYGNSEKDDVAYAIDEFLENHSIAELIEIVAYSVEIKESEYTEENK